MKQIPGELQAHLQENATTLCWCWRLTRRDGVSYGFTDHDRDLLFDQTSFAAASGFTASELSSSLGLSVDNLEAAGALRSDHLNEADLSRGLFDDARVEIFRVNWADPEQRILMSTGSLGEVKREKHRYSAEIRGLSHYLQQPRGRLLQYGCDADLGDARCGIDVGAGSGYLTPGSVVNVVAQHAFTATGLESYPSGWFSRGVLIWQSGANAPARMEVKEHRIKNGGEVVIELWQDMALEIVSGDQFDLIAGCDKQFATCRDKFANQVNFRGFPHVPGNDFIVSYPKRDEPDHDGSSLQ